LFSKNGPFLVASVLPILDSGYWKPPVSHDAVVSVPDHQKKKQIDFIPKMPGLVNADTGFGSKAVQKTQEAT
jgi:hypothetical protein